MQAGIAATDYYRPHPPFLRGPKLRGAGGSFAVRHIVLGDGRRIMDVSLVDLAIEIIAGAIGGYVSPGRR